MMEGNMSNSGSQIPNENNSTISMIVGTTALVLFLPAAVIEQVSNDEIDTKKGPVFATAIIAGVMAAKKTHELIPFCHPLGLDSCKVSITIENANAVIDCRCKVTHKTGVEMEALTGASVAALTIYDMLKALSHDIVISETRLMSKSGGKQDFKRAD